MSYLTDNANRYGVEVSGWDKAENFFVEKTSLYSDEQARWIVLRSRIGQGTMVFLRLLYPPADSLKFPVAYQVHAYQVQKIAIPDAKGFAKIWLKELHAQRRKDAGTSQDPATQPETLVN